VSAGNAAQGVALAARTAGSACSVMVMDTAPEAKLRAIERLGARIVPATYDECWRTVERHGSDRMEGTFVHPFDDDNFISGNGTIGLEILEDLPDVDAVVAPLGGGGLLAGCALAAKSLSPDCDVIGVEPEAGNDGQQSFRKGEVVRIPVPQTIADGAMTTSLGAHTFAVIRALVGDIVTVPDPTLVAAMRFFLERMKIVVEPTGCLAAASVLEGLYPCAGKRVGVVLSGGNIDLQSLRGFLS
jgi:threonine dehydratase